MQRLTSIWLLGSLLTILLTSCAPNPAAPTAVPSTPKPTRVTSTALPTEEPLSVAMPVVSYAGGGSRLVVISFVTGRVFSQFKPISIGDNYNYAFSPDRQTLAMVASGKVQLIDLRSWTVRTIDVGLHGWMSAVVYSPDGRLLALASGEPNSELRIVDVASGKVLAQAQAGCSVRSLAFTADQQAIMLYGPHVKGDLISIGSPIASLYKAADLSKLWSAELSGVQDGAFPKQPNTDIHQPGAAFYYQPATAFAPAGDILYVVHGDEDVMTTVDFHSRRITTASIHEQSSWLEQLLGLTTGVAYAKGMDGTTKAAVISADGKKLYVVSTTSAYTKTSTGMIDVKITHGGLQLIQVEDATLLRTDPGDAEQLTWSSDGKYLFLTGWRNVDYNAVWTDLYDMESGKIVRQMEGLQLTKTQTLDGRPALVSSNSINYDQCDLSSVDATTWKIIGDWHGECLGWLGEP